MPMSIFSSVDLCGDDLKLRPPQWRHLGADRVRRHGGDLPQPPRDLRHRRPPPHVPVGAAPDDAVQPVHGGRMEGPPQAGVHHVPELPLPSEVARRPALQQAALRRREPAGHGLQQHHAVAVHDALLVGQRRRQARELLPGLAAEEDVGDLGREVVGEADGSGVQRPDDLRGAQLVHVLQAVGDSHRHTQARLPVQMAVFSHCSRDHHHLTVRLLFL
uniref:Uncharacterized protein n=1 Tax=Arundo donax TaxID=35708 RepID=A0A0A9EGE3_ARUDO